MLSLCFIQENYDIGLEHFYTESIAASSEGTTYGHHYTVSLLTEIYSSPEKIHIHTHTHTHSFSISLDPSFGSSIMKRKKENAAL